MYSGDGDQSDVKASKPGTIGQSLIDIWSEGADFNPFYQPNGLYTPFIIACMSGDIATVKKFIDLAKQKDEEKNKTLNNDTKDNSESPGASTSTSSSSSSLSSSTTSSSSTHDATNPPSHLYHLTHYRESLMRLSPLHAAIVGSRILPTHLWPSYRIKKENVDHLGVVKLLVENGCDINAKDVAGYSCIHHCFSAYASEYSQEIGKYLLIKGANGNAKNRVGRVPLIECCQVQNIASVKILVDYGDCDPFIKDNDGCWPLQIGAYIPGIKQIFDDQQHRNILLSNHTRVRIKNLKQRTELNGSIGKCIEYIPDTDRMIVELTSEPGRTIALKLDNVHKLDETDGDNDSCQYVCSANHCQEKGTKKMFQMSKSVLLFT